MKVHSARILAALAVVSFFGLFVGIRGVKAQEQGPVDVSGKWTLYCKDPNGSTSAKYLEIKQNGVNLSGHFKGPNQSGGIEGTINEHHILVRTKTRDVLTFRGRADGNTMVGTFHARRGTGQFQAIRTEGGSVSQGGE